MSQVRVNFLNWRPDLEPSAHDGLVLADNVIHQPEGYIPVSQVTTAGFATLTVLATAQSCIVRPVGTAGQHIAARISGVVTATPAANFIIAPATSGAAFTTVALATMASLNAARITAFEVCELDEKIFVVARCEYHAQAGTTTSVNLTGYLDI